MTVNENLRALERKFDSIETELSTASDADTIVRLSRERADLEPIVVALRERDAAVAEREGLAELLADAPSGDELAEMAEAEAADLDEKIVALDHKLKVLLLPKDAADEKGAILEIRAGTGGEEAALFAGDVFRMYQRFAELAGWKVALLNASDSDLGGYREVVASVEGKGAYARLKFESGVHRVQRVPETESGGRIHTSAATVAVLPEAEEVEDRCVPCLRCRRSARQHHRQRRAHHPHPDWPRRGAAGRALAAQEQGEGAEGLARQAVRSGQSRERGRAGGRTPWSRRLR